MSRDARGQGRGQGHASPFAQVLSEKLGIPFERIRLVQGDSDQLLAGGGTGGSRSMMNSGAAIVEASVKVIEQGKTIASHALEASVGDWGTIFTRERLNVTSGLSAVPYVAFTLCMIIGRLRVHTLLHKNTLQELSCKAAVLAGIGFGIPIIIATHLPASWKTISYILFIIGFALGGLGSSFLAPSFTSAANRRSPHPSSVVVGQFGVMNNILTNSLKLILAGVIGLTGSIALALMIPAGLMFVAYFYTKVFEGQ